MQANLFWIPGPWRGRLAIAARPRGGDWLDDEVAAWRRADIDVVLSLLEDSEAAQFGLEQEGRAAEKQGILFASFPIPDRGIPVSTEAAMPAIGQAVTQLNAGKTIALHCRQSIGRAGLIAAALLIESGIKADEAMEIVSVARGVPVPETGEQRKWLEQLSCRVAAAPKAGLEPAA